MCMTSPSALGEDADDAGAGRHRAPAEAGTRERPRVGLTLHDHPTVRQRVVAAASPDPSPRWHNTVPSVRTMQ
jgi:hypothetical protein